jgi:DNA repair protein RadC
MKKIGLQEQVVVLYLNNSNTVIGSCNLSSGSLTSAIIDIRYILASALKLMATGVIISHNHPTGIMIASEKDKELTKKLDKALNLIDIKLLDHIIISPFDEYLSLKDGGIF